jgi:PRTRC genetic system protein A
MHPIGQLPGAAFAVTGEEGERPRGLLYRMAGNGLFKTARVPAAGLTVTVPVALAARPIRGLPALEPTIDLAHGALPAAYIAAILALFAATAALGVESHAAITVRDGAYRLVRREVGAATGGRVRYRLHPGDGAVVLDIHSHHRLPPFFSATDDADDVGVAVYAVVGAFGHPDGPAVRARLGALGHWWPVSLAALVDGPLGVRDLDSPRSVGDGDDDETMAGGGSDVSR